MTIEEAESFARSKTEVSAKLSNEMKVVGLGFVYELIRRIYDSLESPKKCGECKWYRDFEGVCVNDESPLCADFVSEKYGCIHYEPKPIKGDKNV